MHSSSIEPMATTIATAQKVSGVGRTTLYRLIKEKRIRTYRVGTRRLVDLASLRQFLASQED
jgi:excisionase family DNA binding protein